MDEIQSQIKLTSPLNKFPCASPSVRPRSACFPLTYQSKNLTESSRSKSAEFFDLTPDENSLFRFSSDCCRNTMHGDSALSLSLFTDSSSKLLLHLLKEPDKNVISAGEQSLKNNIKNFMGFKAKNLQVQQSLPEINISDRQNNISNVRFFKNTCTAGSKEENPDILIVNSEVKQDLEERLSSISENEPNKTSNDLNCMEQCSYRCCLGVKENFNTVSECNKEFFPVLETSQKQFRKMCLDKERVDAFKKLGDIQYEVPKTDIFESENEQEILKIKNSDETFQNRKVLFLNNDEINANYSNERTLKNENVQELPTFDFDQQVVSAANVVISKSKNLKKCNLIDSVFNSLSSESLRINEGEIDSSSKLVCFQASDSTYNEIIELLQTLEEDNIENHMQKKRLDSKVNNSQALEASNDSICNINDVFAYLKEIERDDTVYENTQKDFMSPSLEKLLKKTSVELAHEVLSLEIQIEDQKKGIKLLKDTIADMKEAKKAAELEHQEILLKTNSDAEALVKRHQKFIKQLLNEKKNLSETVSKLVHDLKSSEEKYKINIKAIEEKHLIEVKRAKDAQAVADKIKRERWMEMKTQKIKEMTVKGLEPELSRMAAQQQQELTELRNLHRTEIEAMELKAARRTSELMDQLRTELTKEKEHAITDKLNSLRASMEREFEEEKIKFHQISQGLKQRIRKLEEKLSSQEAEFSLSLMESKQEIEKEKQKVIRIHQENLDEVKRRHEVELKNLKETLETDKQICLKNQEKQLGAKFLDKEKELREQYKRERDREIEMVIEKFEKEQSKIQTELRIAGENKLKRVKEKLEADIKELEAQAADLKFKFTVAKSEVSEKEELVTQLSSQIRQLHAEINFLRKSCEKMTFEKTQLKEIVQKEFESSINDLVTKNENLQKEIFDLKEIHLQELAKKDHLNLEAKNEMQKELTIVYSRIKAAISKKDKIIEGLREEIKVSNEQYRQLELMLDKQRRNLLLQ